MYRVVPIRLNELVTKSSGLGSMTQAGEELENFQQGRIELNLGETPMAKQKSKSKPAAGTPQVPRYGELYSFGLYDLRLSRVRG